MTNREILKFCIGKCELDTPCSEVFRSLLIFLKFEKEVFGMERVLLALCCYPCVVSACCCAAGTCILMSLFYYFVC